MNKLSLEKFLIDHTKINKKFIRDFFSIQNKEKYKKHHPFIINLDIVSKWLKSRKDVLKETLLNSYHINFDFIILLRDKLEKKSGSGGHNKEFILLTSDCFKRLCMLSKAKKAEKVRDYYIRLEELVDKYKDTIIEAKDKDAQYINKNLLDFY